MDKFITPIILIVVIVVFMFLTSKQQKAMAAAELEKQNSLKEGDKVKTYSGLYGTIVKIYDTNDGKIARLNISQNENEILLVDVNLKGILGIDDKQIIEYDANGTVVSLGGVPVNDNNENNDSINSVDDLKEENNEPLTDEDKSLDDTAKKED